jgi:hypothetical protein
LQHSHGLLPLSSRPHARSKYLPRTLTGFV